MLLTKMFLPSFQFLKQKQKEEKPEEALLQKQNIFSLECKNVCIFLKLIN